ncbi:DUF1109 domain-containing protein [Sphingomonas quercus]|nr:DUF1109 domain-containing protein [Sphingomonas quercus]
MTAQPVRRISPAWARALMWMPVALLLGYLFTRPLHRAALDWSAPNAGIAIAGILLSLALGAGALVAAFTVSVAGSAARLRGGMMAAFAAWLVCAALAIGASAHPAGKLGQGSYCFTFILVAGLPMIGAVLLALRRTRSLAPLRSLALAGGGIGFLSFGLLGFCHPVGMSAVDFAMHLAAALALAIVTVALGRAAVAA